MIASITITRNDWHALEQWEKFYKEYASAIDSHIIVDNASTEEYKTKLKELFPDSIYLYRESNGGTTGAYNTGIRWVLENHPEISAIFLIANDIWINAESIRFLYHQLMSDAIWGAVSPVLLDKNKERIVTFGELLRKDLSLQRLYEGYWYRHDNLPPEQVSECLPGGICMVKSEVYCNVGLQDELLFMYSDENDFFYRVTHAGYKLLAFRNAVAAHCHIVIDGKKNNSSFAWFFIVRNNLFLCKKYASSKIFLVLLLKKIFWYGPKQCIGFLIYEHSLYKVLAYYCGLIYGIFNIRGCPAYIVKRNGVKVFEKL